ncbi:SGNH/GDSL hydrolase family protein, partial [Candidatus Curtissbacteria bacterium]|nr:SGNH/GDSL hydrolase family protein [Candidatus Curtissbacteria bacterium]
MRVNILAKFLLVFFALLATAFLFEVLARRFLPKPENLAKLQSSSLFLHENIPNAVFPYISGGEFSNQIRINSYGFRDDEFSQGKPEGVVRIAVLGDSQEEALQVELFDIWQKVMARRLSEGLGRLVESYNFGLSGYGTDQEWLTLREKVWQFSPDMIILAFSPND